MSRILVIDDDETVSKLLSEFLSSNEFEVEVAMDANQGYSMAIDFHPDLILLDVQLPDVAGFDVIRILKNRDDLRHTAIIMITGTHHQSDHKVKAFQAGADDYVLKPFDMPELLERIKAVLRRSEPPAVQSPAQNLNEIEIYPTPPLPTPTPPPPASPPQSLPSEDPAPPSPVLPLPAESPPEEISQPFSKPETISIRETIYHKLMALDSLSDVSVPPLLYAYPVCLWALSLGGWFLSAGSRAKPALIALGTAGFWGLCVAVLVMSCSLMKISLTWKEGSRLMSLAVLPLLLKLIGGCVTAAVTTLSPFYYTASPAILFKSSSFMIERLDVFEIWMMWFIWKSVRQLKASSTPKAWAVAGVLWPVIAFWQSLWKK